MKPQVSRVTELVNPMKLAEERQYWKIGGVSVAGFSHIAENIPCQDALAFKIKDNGELIAAIADGAGSARLSHLGAQAFVDATVSRVHALPSAGALDIDQIADEIVAAINETHGTLIEEHRKSELDPLPTIKDFAATFLMVVANVDGGAFFHVGDGAGTRFVASDIGSAVVSKPENGEYANETYFVTVEHWESHLRITRFDGAFDTILLMSDGVTPMAMNKGCAGPFEKFVTPVVEFLNKVGSDTGEKALINTLSADNVRTITGDDKTLLWAIRTMV